MESFDKKIKTETVIKTKLSLFLSFFDKLKIMGYNEF